MPRLLEVGAFDSPPGSPAWSIRGPQPLPRRPTRDARWPVHATISAGGPCYGKVAVQGVARGLRTSGGVPVSGIRSKWFQSGGVKSPPQRRPSLLANVPTRAQTVGSVRLAGSLPTRRSTASAGRGRWRLWVAGGSVGLRSDTTGLSRAPLMIQRPGQRIPWQRKCSDISRSRESTRHARAGAIPHRRTIPSTSRETRSERTVLTQACGK